MSNSVWSYIKDNKDYFCCLHFDCVFNNMISKQILLYISVKLSLFMWVTYVNKITCLVNFRIWLFLCYTYVLLCLFVLCRLLPKTKLKKAKGKKRIEQIKPIPLLVLFCDFWCFCSCVCVFVCCSFCFVLFFVVYIGKSRSQDKAIIGVKITLI